MKSLKNDNKNSNSSLELNITLVKMQRDVVRRLVKQCEQEGESFPEIFKDQAK